MLLSIFCCLCRPTLCTHAIGQETEIHYSSLYIYFFMNFFVWSVIFLVIFIRFSISSSLLFFLNDICFAEKISLITYVIVFLFYVNLVDEVVKNIAAHKK